jgi:Tol biopolymer transport system component
MRVALLALTAAFLPVALLGGDVEPAGSAFPGRDGLIAFDRLVGTHKGGLNDRIITVKPNGKRLNAITPRCCKSAEDPAWSADGDRIAFVRGRNIFSMNKKGKKLRRLTRGKRENGKRFEDTDPSWSPDGSQVVFSRLYGGNDDSDLFVVDADGSNLHRIESLDFEYDPAWSPDGERIAFVRDTLDQPSGIYRVRPDGTDLELVLELTDLRDGLDWSPDGERLAFSTRESGGGPPQIHTVRPDGTGVNRVTSERGAAYDPAFSPRGDRIVFSFRGEELKLVDSDGGDVKRLLKRTRGRGEFAPHWQPR